MSSVCFQIRNKTLFGDVPFSETNFQTTDFESPEKLVDAVANCFGKRSVYKLHSKEYKRDLGVIYAFFANQQVYTLEFEVALLHNSRQSRSPS